MTNLLSKKFEELEDIKWMKENGFSRIGFKYNSVDDLLRQEKFYREIGFFTDILFDGTLVVEWSML